MNAQNNDLFCRYSVGGALNSTNNLSNITMSIYSYVLTPALCMYLRMAQKHAHLIRFIRLREALENGTVIKHSDLDYSVKCSRCGEARHYTGDYGYSNVIVNFDHLCRRCSKLGNNCARKTGRKRYNEIKFSI